MLFDVKPRLIDKNIDIILLDKPAYQASKEQLLATPDRYLACGELKGGIDPAGTDEHWKTAGTALGRIRNSFEKHGVHRPKLFFVGAAIATAMARDIFNELQNGNLSYAANLTKQDQLSDLANWLIML